MKTCKEYQELFIEAYYGELAPDVKAEVAEHLASCVECTAEYKELESTLLVLNKRERVEPNEEYWKEYWNTLSASIESGKETTKQTEQRSPLRFASMPSWAYGIAAMLLIAVGLYLGKFLYSPEPAEHQQTIISSDTGTSNIPQKLNQEQPVVEQSQDALADANQASGETMERRTVTTHPTKRVPVMNAIDKEARSYLDRSKIMLLGLINSDEEDPLSLSNQQAVSRTLLRQAIDLKPRLIEPDQKRVKKLIEELEVILLQLANIEEESDLPAVELVKKGVDEKSILLKINMEEMRMMKSKEPRKNSGKKEQKNSL